MADDNLSFQWDFDKIQPEEIGSDIEENIQVETGGEKIHQSAPSQDFSEPTEPRADNFESPNTEPQNGANGNQIDPVSTAAMWVLMMDHGVSTVCHAIDDSRSAESFRLSDKDERRYTEVSEQFFKSVQWTPSPEWMFAISTAMIFGPKVVDAGMKKRKIAKQKAAEAKVKKFTENNKGAAAIQNIVKQTTPVVEPEPENIYKDTPEFIEGRRDFSIDSNNRYENTAGKPTYIKIKDRKDEAHPLVLTLIKQGMENKDIRKMMKL